MADLILHIGMPKTGTSALQDGLAAQAAELAAQGVLFPTAEIGKRHGFLRLAFAEAGKPPHRSLVRAGVDPQSQGATFDASLERLAADVAANRPSRVVLSQETLFWAPTADTGAGLIARLATIFDRVSAVVYVRQPSRAYASAVRQQLKFAGQYRPPAFPPLRQQLDLWDRLTKGRLQVRGYDRALLVNGDILDDFAVGVLGLAPLAGPRPTAVNESLSAEAAAILQDFQRRFLPGADGRDPWPKQRLRRALFEADRLDPPPRAPDLHQSLATVLDHGATDLLWLRECHGITFPAIDYGAIRPMPLPEGHWRDLAEVIPVDPGRKARLERQVFHRLNRLALFRAWHSILPRARVR